jgi:glycosyltransferase involved in cell wall biosynthesis
MNEVANKGFSIILCTHNGAGKLKPTLQHLAALGLPAGIPVEVLLVNNASTDNTEAFSLQVWNELEAPFPLRIINEPRAGKGYAIETGYDAAQYAYIITVDDDNWLREDYLINALTLINTYPDVGIFQAGNEPVFEKKPPEWIKHVEGYLVIGSPVKQPGYFKQNYYGVWGAGMIIFKKDWVYLRSLGFAALTSKMPGKAAGEDVELAIALLLTGRKIFYSDKLQYKHYMPAGRVKWESLEKNFDAFAYTDYYFFLYTEVFRALREEYSISAGRFRMHFFKHWLRLMKSQGLRNNSLFFYKKEGAVYQLLVKKYYRMLYWFFKLSGKAVNDMSFVKQWALPLMEKNPESSLFIMR